MGNYRLLNRPPIRWLQNGMSEHRPKSTFNPFAIWIERIFAPPEVVSLAKGNSQLSGARLDMLTSLVHQN
jgi:hypothetical protein